MTGANPRSAAHRTLPSGTRNADIARRFLEGERALGLAREFGVSKERVYVIIRDNTDLVDYERRIAAGPAERRRGAK